MSHGGARSGSGRKSEGLDQTAVLKLDCTMKERIQHFATKRNITFSEAARYYIERGIKVGSSQCPERTDIAELPKPEDVMMVRFLHLSEDKFVPKKIIPLPQDREPTFDELSAHVGSKTGWDRIIVPTIMIVLSVDGVFFQEFVLPRKEGMDYLWKIADLHADDENRAWWRLARALRFNEE